MLRSGLGGADHLPKLLIRLPVAESDLASGRSGDKDVQDVAPWLPRSDGVQSLKNAELTSVLGATQGAFPNWRPQIRTIHLKHRLDMKNDKNPQRAPRVERATHSPKSALHSSPQWADIPPGQ